MPKNKVTGILIHVFNPNIIRFANGFTIMDYLVLLNSNIHFTEVHKHADQLLKNKPATQHIFVRDNSVLVPEKMYNLWSVKESNQATTIGLAVAPYMVDTGTITEMRDAYPGEPFFANQKNPDFGQVFSKSNLPYKSSVGGDFKNTTGKTIFDGRNQVLISTHSHYEIILNNFVNSCLQRYDVPQLVSITVQLAKYAKNGQLVEQAKLIAENQHKFPVQWNPPMRADRKFHYENLIPEMQKEYVQSLRRMTRLSNKANKAQPEDYFNDSFIKDTMRDLQVDTGSGKDVDHQIRTELGSEYHLPLEEVD